MAPQGLARLKPIVRGALPPAVRRWLYWLVSPEGVAGGRAPASLYERLYEACASAFSEDDAVGDGRLFDLIGRIELSLLVMEGLRPTATLVDFGCGTGRLAVHVIPWLKGGQYIGIDIAQSMLDRADARVRRVVPAPPCRVTWVKQTDAVFALEDGTVDCICAFSVFTHLEHEDTYRYLKDARRVIGPEGRFVLSCLPMDLPVARDLFLASARDDLEARWSKVRTVTTSIDLMESIARLAGWTPGRWYPGNEYNVREAKTGEMCALGQSSLVLEASPSGLNP